MIETGTGNCHIYVDASANLDMAVDIIFNAKTQRIGVCNACESLVVHSEIAQRLLPAMKKRLDEKQVELRGDGPAKKILPDIPEASDEDWGREYLDYILSVKTVSSLDEAIAHINRYNTGHSETIVTESYTNAQRFLDEVDAAAVYVNASTRFTDGFEFGFGAEIGISTQKPVSYTHLITAQLRVDVEEGRLLLGYQPQIHADQGIVGAEALLRWKYMGEMVYPPLLVALAQEDGFFDQLTECVVQQAMSVCGEILREGREFNVCLLYTSFPDHTQ